MSVEIGVSVVACRNLIVAHACVGMVVGYDDV